jgi:hypothetical protein
MNQGRYGSEWMPRGNVPTSPSMPSPIVSARESLASLIDLTRSASDLPPGAGPSSSLVPTPTSTPASADARDSSVESCGDALSAGAGTSDHLSTSVSAGASRKLSALRNADGWFSGNWLSRIRRLSSNSAGERARPSTIPLGGSRLSSNERLGGRSRERMPPIVLGGQEAWPRIGKRRGEWCMSCMS